MKHLKSKDFMDLKFPFMISKNNITDYPVHTHEFYEFFYVITGKCLHVMDGREETVSSGDLVLLEPGRLHGMKKAVTEQFEVYNCIFLPGLLESRESLLKDMKGFLEYMYLEPFGTGLNKVHLSGHTNLKVLILLEELYAEYTGRTKGREAAIKILLSDLMVTIVRFYERQKKETPGKGEVLAKQANAIMKSISYIDAHFKNDISLDDISLNRTGITKEYFCSVFKKITGMTFTEYVNKLRIEEAAGQLSSTGKPVAEIAYASGFNDLSYFNRSFKEAKGVTPGAFREKKK